MSSSQDTLDALLECKPPAFEVQDRSDVTACGVLKVEPEEAVAPREFSLRITCNGRDIRVCESNTGEQLPAACPERHIEEDGNLCIGLGAGQDVVTPTEIDTWWSHLYQFLVLQISAEHTGQWPPKYALAHGAGGAAQLKATQTAGRLGVLEHYKDHLLGTKNEVADLVSNFQERRAEALKKNRPTTHLDDALLNWSMEWTRGQGGKNITDRKRARLIRALAKYEIQRMEKERDFWDHCRKAGMSCCETMRLCPLREVRNADTRHS